MACTLVLLAVFFVVILAVVVVIVGILLLLLYFLERKSVRETDEGFGSVARSSGFFFVGAGVLPHFLYVNAFCCALYIRSPYRYRYTVVSVCRTKIWHEMEIRNGNNIFFLSLVSFLFYLPVTS